MKVEMYCHCKKKLTEHEYGYDCNRDEQGHRCNRCWNWKPLEEDTHE